MADSKKKEVTLEELRTQMLEMLEQAKTESAALVANARAEAARILAEAGRSGPVGMTPEEQAAYEAYMNEEVEVKLFQDNDRYREPVFVGCNGETVAIQRGVRVKLRRKFAEILDNSDKQDYETGQMIRRKCAEFAGMDL